MIKRLIFDIDNTLIPWKNEYYITFNKILDNLHYQYNEQFILKLIEAVDNYENEYQIYDKCDMLQLMNKYTGRKLPDNFIDLWLEELAICCNPADKNMIETLNYLYQKYDLVILTNWFDFSQIKRLECAGISKYFSHIYSADKFKIKPNMESYLTAAGEYKISECVMIGDNIKADIDGATAVGMNTIYYNYNNMENTKGYKSVTKFEDLKDIL